LLEAANPKKRQRFVSEANVIKNLLAFLYALELVEVDRFAGYVTIIYCQQK